MSTSVTKMAAKLWPYVIVGILIVVQGGLVALIVQGIAPWLHIAQFGPLLAWTLFVIGGFVLGLIELRLVQEGEALSDPLNRWCCWLQRRLHILGFAINSLTLGAMGASIGLKHEGRPHQKVWCFVAAVLYASLWIPLYLAVPFLA